LLGQKKWEKEKAARMARISLRFVPQSRRSPGRISLSCRATSVIPLAALRALGPRLAMLGSDIWGLEQNLSVASLDSGRDNYDSNWTAAAENHFLRVKYCEQKKANEPI
jgi:hypothetical protein